MGPRKKNGLGLGDSEVVNNDGSGKPVPSPKPPRYGIPKMPSPKPPKYGIPKMPIEGREQRIKEVIGVPLPRKKRRRKIEKNKYNY